MLKSLLQSFDIYGKPILMTHKGNQKFKTIFGGLVSLLVCLFLFAMFWYKFHIMITRQNTSVKQNSIINASSKLTPAQDIGAYGYSIAIGLTNPFSAPLTYDKKYGVFQMSQNKYVAVTNSTTNVTSRVFSTSSIPFSQCNSSSPALQNVDPSILAEFPISEYFCPDWMNLTLRGIFNSPEF